MEYLKNQLEISTIEKYPTVKKKIGYIHETTYHPEHTLFWISEKILEWFYNDEFGIIIIHGQQGYGKSSYGCISCAEVYGHNLENSNYYYNWRAVKKHIVWTPRDFITISRKLPKENNSEYKIHPNLRKKEPLVIWDDAGYYLNAMDYRDKLCIKISKFLEVARTRWACIIFTVTNQQQLLSKIRNIPHAWSVPIKKPPGTPSRYQEKYKWKHDKRFAQLHKSWCSEDLKKSGKKGKEGDIFWARLPGHYNYNKPDWIGWNKPNNFEDLPKENKPTFGFYGWYKPLRDTYCDEALVDLDEAAKEIGL